MFVLAIILSSDKSQNKRPLRELVLTCLACNGTRIGSLTKTKIHTNNKTNKTQSITVETLQKNSNYNGKNCSSSSDHVSSETNW